VGAGVSLGTGSTLGSGVASSDGLGDGVARPTVGSVGFKPEMKRPRMTATRIVPITAPMEIRDV
jgi:hypothetical protein